jgi:hypothetical protein
MPLDRNVHPYFGPGRFHAGCECRYKTKRAAHRAHVPYIACVPQHLASMCRPRSCYARTRTRCPECCDAHSASAVGQKETKIHVRCHGSFRRNRPWYPPRHEHTRPRSQAGPPMTLGNMRANGVRSLDVCCWLCHHRAILSADPWPDHVPVPMFGPRMVCTRCGIIGAEARPDSQEQPGRETLIGTL